MNTQARRFAVLALVVLAFAAVFAQDEDCDQCLKAHYWRVPLASAGGVQTFPETQALLKARPGALDFGIAFSGGGTRSASATVGTSALMMERSTTCWWSALLCLR